jgi:hypothetical protein
MTDIVNILQLVLKAMVSMEQVLTLKGEEKKTYVIGILEKQLPNYNDYKEIIPVIIELVIILSRQSLDINLKKKIEKCCVMF